MTFENKKKKATTLKIAFEADVTEEKLDELIKLEEDKIELEIEQGKIKKANEKKAAEEAKKNKIILQNTLGEDVAQKDYFFHYVDPKTGEEKIDTAPASFNKVCGYPVDREDLIEIFHLSFPASKDFLFYKLRDKEVYLVIVPLKYAKTISKFNESMAGDFQKHSLSFIGEGSVNMDTLKMKLERIAKHGSSISTEPIAK